MLQIAAVILEPLAAAALNEEGRRTQQGEQEQERAGQREEAYSQAYRKAQSTCRKFPRKRGALVKCWAYKWGSRRMEPHSARTLARFPCSDQNSRGADHILLTYTRGNSTVRWPLRGATVSGGDH
jgi:hypothetical protein